MKNKILRNYLYLFLSVIMIVSVMPTKTYGNDKNLTNSIITDTAKYLTTIIPNPDVGTLGGEWAIIGLSRSDYNVPKAYYEQYYKNVEKYVVDNKGMLHDKKYTEYSRIIIALTAIGKDPTNVAGYNLLEPLADFEKTIYQGINGSVFALIALDSGNYEIPKITTQNTQATREMYIDEILSKQLPDGGFALGGTTADADITAMVIQALSKYQHRKNVQAATNKAIETLSALQNSQGGYEAKNIENLESTAQVLMALCEMNISVDDDRFVKNGNTIIDNMLLYYKEEKGFVHSLTANGENLMSTEQGLYALVNANRIMKGKTSLYNMTDTSKKETANPNQTTKKLPILNTAKTFTDIKNHQYKKEIEALARRNIINGISDTQFLPDKTLTRAEFATIITKSLSLGPKIENVFSDVDKTSWYAPYIGSAYENKIISGTSDNTFEPEKTITKEEAAVILANAAKLWGLNTNMPTSEIKDTLSKFKDYNKTTKWSQEALAFCYDHNIFNKDESYIDSSKKVTRGEIAKMLYNMLKLAEMID